MSAPLANDADPTTGTDTETEQTAAAAADQGDNGATTELEPEGADQLGDAGKKALDAMKAKWKAAEKRANEAAAELAKVGKTPDEQAIEEAKRAATAEATAKANARILKAEIRAAAAGKLADPADALRLLDVDDFEVSDDGEVDADEIAAAIADLIKSKPYLAADTGKRYPANDTNATRKGAEGPSQLSEQDVKRLYAAKDYDAIEKARQEGRLNDVLGIKPT